MFDIKLYVDFSLTIATSYFSSCYSFHNHVFSMLHNFSLGLWQRFIDSLMMSLATKFTGVLVVESDSINVLPKPLVLWLLKT